MKFCVCILSAAIALCVAVPAVTLAQSSLAAGDGVVLLRNGQTLEGNVTRTGDYYLVTRGATSEVRLPAAAVERVFANLEALYRHKAAAIESGNSEGHIALARWCLQHDLPDRAADQTLMAFALEPRNSGLMLVERQLVALEHQPAKIVAAGGESPSIPSSQEIEEAIETLPASAMQGFVTTVQPLLMNRCATGGCHSQGGQSDQTAFQLFRPNPRQVMSRRMTQRNLFAALAFVDRDHPAQSQLLNLAKTAHGGREAAFSEAETQQVELLAKWVAALGRQPTAALPSTVARPPVFLLQTQPNAMSQLMAAASAEETSTSATTPASPSSDEGPNRPGDAYVPRDPFDAEVFNRRFRRPAPGSQ